MKTFSFITQIITIWVSLFSFAGLGLAQGTLITFDGPPRQPAGTDQLISRYFDSGFEVGVTNEPPEPGETFILSGGGVDTRPENGTPYIQSQPSGIMLRSTTGSLFGLRAMDVAGYSVVVPDISLIVLGYRSDGAVLTSSLGGTGIAWRTISFDDEWASGLSRVEFLGASYPYYPTWSVDNIMLNVPEPFSGLLLLAAGAAALCLRAVPRRSRQHTQTTIGGSRRGLGVGGVRP